MKSYPHTSPWRSSWDILWEESYGLRWSVQSSATEILWRASEIRRRYLGQLESSLLAVGTCEDHLKDIVSLLRLTDLCTEETHGESFREAREFYFYRAVTIGRRYLWDRLWEDSRGIDIFRIYTSCIAPWIQPIHLSEPTFVKLAYTGIKEEVENRKNLLLNEAKKTDIYLEGVRDHNDIIRKIESVFWPVRLLILSEESGEPITIHRMDARKIKSIRKSARKYEYTLKVDILGQSRKYRVIIDYGSSEDRNRPEEDHIKDIINPILVRHIEQKEDAVISYARDYRDITQKVEKTMRLVETPDDYSRFVEMVLSDTGNNSISAEVRDNPEYARECQQALELSRMLTLSHATWDNDRDRIVTSMDTILWGKITRGVLDMTRAILISRTEMMSGSGCPFGLSKDYIPLEARIHTIIRAYEALCHEEQEPERVRIRMNEWNQWWYFDAHIFSIFMKFLDAWWLASGGERAYADIWSIPDDRKWYYLDFLEAYDEQRVLVEKIEEAYMSFHDAGDSELERNRLAIVINDLQDELVKKINFTKIFGVMGHGQGPSDIKMGQPGGYNEGLTSEWKRTSRVIWQRLKRTSLTLITGPYRRTFDTAWLIQSGRKDTIWRMNDIIIVDALRNPKKDLPNIRGTDAYDKIVKDNPIWILDFVRRIVLSPRESVNVIVAHGTTGNYVLGKLDNLGSRNEANIKTLVIEPTSIEVRLVRWGRRVEWDLVFPFEDWKDVLEEVDMMCVSTFGVKFSRAEMKGIQHIKLHKKFLDYMDRRIQESPEKVVEFLRRLDEWEHTKHFRSMLRKSDLANKKLLF